MQIPSRWNRIVLGAGPPQRALRTGDVVLPPIRGVDELPVELAGLTPSRNHNDDLIRSLDGMPPCASGERPVIAVFAADPFLRVDQLADRLAQNNYRDVVNLPTVAQYGAAFRPALDGLDLGTAREMRALREFAERGFAVSVSIAHVDDLDAALALAPARLFVVPSFDLWREGKLDGRGLIALCGEAVARRLRAAARSPIVLFADRTVIGRDQAHAAGADGVLMG